MKTKTFFLNMVTIMTVAVFSLCFTSCSDDEAEDQISVSSPSINFDENGGIQNISLSSNTNWTVYGAQSWLTVSPMTGSGNGAITVSANENTEKTSRNCTLTLSAGNAIAIVVVSQAGKRTPTSITVTNKSVYTLSRFTIHFISAEKLQDGEEISSRDFGTLYPNGTITVDLPTGAKGYYMSTYLSGKTFFSPDYSIEYSKLDLTDAEVGRWRTNASSSRNIQAK